MRDKLTEDRSDVEMEAVLKYPGTVESVQEREKRLLELFQGNPTVLENAELIRAYKFGQRLIRRLMGARDDAEDPKLPFGVVALKQVKEGNFPEQRARAIKEYGELIRNLVLRLEVFHKEFNARVRDGKIKEEEVPSEILPRKKHRT